MSAPGLMDAAASLLSHELAVRLGAFLGDDTGYAINRRLCERQS